MKEKMLITLVYGSISTHPMSQNDLLALLEQSREYNKKNNITGMLLYKACRFLQVLEGEEDVLDELYKKINQDDRHHHTIIYLKKEIDEREFGKWQMGFLNLELDKYKSIKDFTDFLQHSDEMDRYTDDPSEAYMLLKNFKQYLN